MDIYTLTSGALSWFWGNFGKELVERSLDKVKKQWEEFNWEKGEETYRKRLIDLYTTTRLLGHPKPINILDMFTDVFVLDKPTAFKRYELSELQSRPLSRDSLTFEEKRVPALRLVLGEKRLYILGKPGSGKTTFLKYLTFQACAGKINKTPIFISLKEWSDSRLPLIKYIALQFEICGFPNSESFVIKLLDSGKALLLFDGLDEVNQEGRERSEMIKVLTNFANQYPEIQICLTCRIAASDYSFEQFTYIEIADFDEKQVKIFVGKWYHEDMRMHRSFLTEFNNPRHEGIRELTKTPLLLALLCLAYDETLSFPLRRVDIYREALDALLKRWDSSRGVKRDDIYKDLSTVRKEQMLSRIAAQNFDAGNYFIRKDKIISQIYEYIEQLPPVDNRTDPDGEAILRAIEVQHGLLIERAHDIYSFSHLTFQEYFTARYIVDNAIDGTIDRLVRQHFSDNRWNEVFLLTASLLDNCDSFFEIYLITLMEFLGRNTNNKNLFEWINNNATLIKQNTLLNRLMFIYYIIGVNLGKKLRKTKDPNISLTRRLLTCREASVAMIRLIDPNTERSLQQASIRALSRSLHLSKRSSGAFPEISISEDQLLHLSNYLSANLLLLECLQLAVVKNRNSILDKVMVIKTDQNLQN